METLREKIRKPDRGVILYELIPPTQETEERNSHAYVECTTQLLASTSVAIDAINLPEIRDERRDGQRTHLYEPKADPRVFAQQLEAGLQTPVELVVNRCTVYESWPMQKEWLCESHNTFGMRNLVLVGGESSKIQYPGPSVLEMAQAIRHTYEHTFFCGGITIPTRRSEDKGRDEPHRLVEKARHGVEFFVSQVLYEPTGIRSLLHDYYRVCEANGEEAKRIFLSFSPVSCQKDLQFLKWLGVEIPSGVEQTLFKVDLGIGWRSLQVAQRVLQEILDFVRDEHIEVPLGLNIEHITRRNFELSKEFIDQLGAIYYESLHLVGRRAA